MLCVEVLTTTIWVSMVQDRGCDDGWHSATQGGGTISNVHDQGTQTLLWWQTHAGITFRTIGVEGSVSVLREE